MIEHLAMAHINSNPLMEQRKNTQVSCVGSHLERRQNWIESFFYSFQVSMVFRCTWFSEWALCANIMRRIRWSHFATISNACVLEHVMDKRHGQSITKLYRTNAPARSIFLASHEWGFFHFGHKNRLKFLCGLEPPLPSIVSTLRLVFPERRCLGQFDSVEMEWMQKYTGNGVN